MHGYEVNTVFLHDNFIISVASLNTGRVISVNSVDGNPVRLIGFNDGLEKFAAHYHGYILTGEEDGDLTVWDVSTGDLVTDLTGHSAPIVAVHGFEKFMASANDTGKIIIRSIKSALKDEDATITIHATGYPNPAVTPNSMCFGKNFIVRHAAFEAAVTITDFIKIKQCE